MTTNKILETYKETDHKGLIQKEEELAGYYYSQNNLLKENPEINSVCSLIEPEYKHQNQSIQKVFYPLNQTQRMMNSEPNHQITESYELKSLNQIRVSNKQFSNKTFTPYKEKLKVYTQSSSIQEIQNEEKKPKQIIKQQTAKQVLLQLQEVLRKKSIQKKELNLHKSLDLKTRVVKLNPEKTKEKNDKKKKQAEQRLKVNIEFLQRLKLRPKYQKPSFKQFRNYSQNTLKSIKSIKLKAINKIDFGWIENGNDNAIRYSTDRNSSPQIQKTERILQKMNILIQSPLKLPPIESNRCVKPKPYSIYNIHQKHNEIFTNLSSKNCW